MIFCKGNDMNLGRMVSYWQKFVLFLLTIYLTILHSLGTQLGTRTRGKSEIQCASGRWNILGNIIYAKYVVGPYIKLCYFGSYCKEITHSTRLWKEVLGKLLFGEHVTVLLDEKRERVEICLRFCRRNRKEQTNRKTYAHMGVRSGVVG